VGLGRQRRRPYPVRFVRPVRRATGTGKSSFLIWKAAQIPRSELPGAFKGHPWAVIYVAVEDSWKFTIVPRLMAASADLTKVYRAEVETADEETDTLSLPADNRLLRRRS
jgi:hypothetical protein